MKRTKEGLPSSLLRNHWDIRSEGLPALMKKSDVSKIETWENAFNLFKEGSYNDTIPDDQG